MTKQEFEKHFEEALKLYQAGTSINQLANKYNMNNGYLYRIFQNHGVKIRPHAIALSKSYQFSFLPFNEVKAKEKEIIQKFESGHNIDSLANEYKTNSTVIKELIDNILLSNKLTNTNIQQSGKYKYDVAFFDLIDTEEKAYYLGFFFADGCNAESQGRIQFNISKKDENILVGFQKAVKTDAPIIDRKPCHIKGTNFIGKPTVQFILYCKQYSKQLAKLGAPARKSKILEFPTYIPVHLMRHFIRGYFDGDGAIAKAKKGLKFSVISTENFCCGIKDELALRGIEAPIYQNNRGYWYVEITNSGDCKKAFDWLYKDANCYCERKYNRYYEFYYGSGEITTDY